VRSGSTGVGDAACEMALGCGGAVDDASAAPDNKNAPHKAKAEQPASLTVHGTRTN